MREPEVRGAAWELEAGDQLVSPQAGLSVGGVPGLPWRLGCGGVSRASRTGTLSEGRCPWCCPWKSLSVPQGGGGWAPGICAGEDKPSGSRWQGRAAPVCLCRRPGTWCLGVTQCGVQCPECISHPCQTHRADGAVEMGGMKGRPLGEEVSGPATLSWEMGGQACLC